MLSSKTPIIIGTMVVAQLILTDCSEQNKGSSAQVKSREIAFAKTMADRDLNAFKEFISPEAVFFGGKGPLRGHEAIITAWAPYFEEESPPFSWHPDQVQMLDSGQLAFSSGPVLGASGEEIGRFNSVWRLDPDGQWRVVFDKGS